jgi:hypothetical protein
MPVSYYIVTNSDKPFAFRFPRADIYKMILPDMLHQLLKGCFQDHLMEWLEEVIKKIHGRARYLSIMADIDRR